MIRLAVLGPSTLIVLALLLLVGEVGTDMGFSAATIVFTHAAYRRLDIADTTDRDDDPDLERSDVIDRVLHIIGGGMPATEPPGDDAEDG